MDRRTRRSGSVVFAALVVGLGGCRRADPEWARWPAVAARGDATVEGAPARVGRFSSPPVIDGKLDDPAWKDATALGPFGECSSGTEDLTGPVAGFARIGWDDARLYLGFVVRDKAPVATFERDAMDPHVWGRSSAVEAMIQPGDPGDNRDYYELQVDTRGAVFDSHFDDYNAPITVSGGTGNGGAGNGAGGADKVFGHQEWSAHAERAAFVAQGTFYAIEAALPWSAFTPSVALGRAAIPPRPGDVWRLNLYSFRDGQRAALAWSPIRGQGNFHKSARFGRVKFE